MGLYQLPKQFHTEFGSPNKKPLTAVQIDWTNPLSRGLRAVVLFNEASGDALDIVSGENLSVSSAISRVITKEGRGIQGVIDNANSKVALPLDPFGENWEGVTISSLVEIDDGGRDSYFPGIVTNVQSGLFHGNWNLQLEKAPGPIYDFSFRGGNNQEKSHVSINRFSDGDIVNIGGVYSAVSGNRFIKSFIDGKLLGTETAGITNNWTSSATLSSIGHYFRTTERSFPGKFFYVFLWDRPLSDGEYKAFVGNPYHLLKPFVPAMYFTPEAVVGATRRYSLSLTGAG